MAKGHSMNFNLSLVADCLGDIHRDATVHRCFKRALELDFERVVAYTGQERLKKRCLYIMDAEAYGGLPAEWAEPDAGLLVVGKRREQRVFVPTIFFDGRASVEDLLQNVQEMRTWLADWERDVLLAMVGRISLKEAFDVLARAFKNPLMLSDSALCFVLTAGHLPEDFYDRLWTPAIETGVCPIELYREAWTSVDANAFSRADVCRVEGSSTGHTYLFRNLIVDGHVHGLVEAVDANVPLCDSDEVLLEHAGRLLEAAVARRAFSEIAVDANDPLCEAVKGATVRDAVLRYGLRMRGWDMDDAYYVTYVEHLTKSEAQEEWRRQTQRRFELSYPMASVFADGDGCVMIAREKDYPFENLRARFELGTTQVDDAQFQAGVSAVQGDFRNLAIAAEQARSAFARVRGRHGGVIGRTLTCFFDDSYCADVADCLRFEEGPAWLVPRMVAELARSDAEEGTDYVATVAAYLDHACNANPTAAALFVHRNTLTYRLKRIKALYGLELEHPEESGVDLLRVHLACRLILEGREGRETA